MSKFKPNNKLFKYHGRWGKSDEGYVAYWSRAYVEFNIKCNTLHLKFGGNGGGYTIEVDGMTHSIVQTGVDLTCYFKDNTIVHNVKILTIASKSPTIFKGIETDGEILLAPNKKKNFLFIGGDSFTASNLGISAYIPAQLNADYDCVAMMDLALCNGNGRYLLPDWAKEDYVREGMESAFFKEQNPYIEGERIPYKFSKTKYNGIFIGFGPHDAITNEERSTTFVNKYVQFIKKISALWPKTPIYIIQAVIDNEGGYLLNAIDEAGKKAEAEIANVKYIPSRNWDIEVMASGTMPTTNGYKKYNENVLKAIKK